MDVFAITIEHAPASVILKVDKRNQMKFCALIMFPT
jgi:hypothetical protein